MNKRLVIYILQIIAAVTFGAGASFLFIAAKERKTQTTLKSAETFSLTLDTLSGNRYIMDTGLTLEDCSDAMMNEPGRGWGCQRESPNTAL